MNRKVVKSKHVYRACAEANASIITKTGQVITSTATATATSNISYEDAYNIAFNIAKSIALSKAQNEANLSEQLINELSSLSVNTPDTYGKSKKFTLYIDPELPNKRGGSSSTSDPSKDQIIPTQGIHK